MMRALYEHVRAAADLERFFDRGDQLVALAA